MCARWCAGFAKSAACERSLSSLPASCEATEAPPDDTCGICLVPHDKPIKLPCDHTFCVGCIREYQKHSKSDARCPYCRADVPDQITLPMIENACAISRRMTNIPRYKDRPECIEQLHRAAAIADEALVLAPKNLEAKVCRSELCAHLGEWERCVALSEELAALKQGEATDDRGRIYNLTTEFQVGIQLTLAEGLMGMRRWQEAVEALQMALQKGLEPSMAKPVRSLFHYFSQCQYHLGDYDTCIQMGEAAIKSNRTYDGVYKHIALAHEATGNLDEAIVTMRRAVAYKTPWDKVNLAILQDQLDRLLAKQPGAS